MAKNGGYSAAELMVMQRDAAERVRQMQRRARERMAASPPPSPPAAERTDLPAGQVTGGAAGLIGSFASDPDRMLLLALIFLLAREEADPKLLLALVYLML